MQKFRNLMLVAASAMVIANVAPVSAAQDSGFTAKFVGKDVGQVSATAASGLKASDIIGARVVSADNKDVGEVDDLIVAKSGEIHGAVIAVGGFLGVGEKSVVVPMERLKINKKDGNLLITLNATKEELKAAKAYNANDWQKYSYNDMNKSGNNQQAQTTTKSKSDSNQQADNSQSTMDKSQQAQDTQSSDNSNQQADNNQSSMDNTQQAQGTQSMDNSQQAQDTQSSDSTTSRLTTTSRPRTTASRPRRPLSPRSPRTATSRLTTPSRPWTTASRPRRALRRPPLSRPRTMVSRLRSVRSACRASS